MMSENDLRVREKSGHFLCFGGKILLCEGHCRRHSLYVCLFSLFIVLFIHYYFILFFVLPSFLLFAVICSGYWINRTLCVEELMVIVLLLFLQSPSTPHTCLLYQPNSSPDDLRGRSSTHGYDSIQTKPCLLSNIQMILCFPHPLELLLLLCYSILIRPLPIRLIFP